MKLLPVSMLCCVSAS